MKRFKILRIPKKELEILENIAKKTRGEVVKHSEMQKEIKENQFKLTENIIKNIFF